MSIAVSQTCLAYLERVCFVFKPFPGNSHSWPYKVESHLWISWMMTRAGPRHLRRRIPCLIYSTIQLQPEVCKAYFKLACDIGEYLHQPPHSSKPTKSVCNATTVKICSLQYNVLFSVQCFDDHLLRDIWLTIPLKYDKERC